MAAKPDFSLTDAEKALMQKHQLAVFEGRIIHNAQPPITLDEQKRIEATIQAPIPGDVLRLWQTAFGGSLDYELFVDYEAGLHPFSFAQLFLSPITLLIFSPFVFLVVF